jgi:hypothetical protein
MIEQYPRGICCHEAGHAIVASWFNLQVEAIYVRFEEAKGWYGRTITASPRHLPIPDQIANWAAGKAAEEFFGCPAPEESWLDDFGEISSLLNRSDISLEELWPRIDEGKLLAAAILEKRYDEAFNLINRLAEHGYIDAVDFLILMNSKTP